MTETPTDQGRDVAGLREKIADILIGTHALPSMREVALRYADAIIALLSEGVAGGGGD